MTFEPVTYAAELDLTPERVKVELWRGDAWSITGVALEVDEDGTETPIDITAGLGTITADVRSEADASAEVAAWTVTVVDGPNGEFTLTMAASTTEDLAGWYVSDVQWTPTGGGPTTMVVLDMHVMGDRTR